MITDFKLFENKYNHKYLNVKLEICPVCNTEGNFDDTNDMDIQFENYYICPNCNFEWYTLWTKDDLEPDADDIYSIEGKFETGTGDRIIPGDKVPNELYNEYKASLKLKTDKFKL